MGSFLWVFLFVPFQLLSVAGGSPDSDHVLVGADMTRPSLQTHLNSTVEFLELKAVSVAPVQQTMILGPKRTLSPRRRAALYRRVRWHGEDARYRAVPPVRHSPPPSPSQSVKKFGESSSFSAGGGAKLYANCV